MLKRVAAAFLWYAMVWVGYEIVWSITGVPRLIGPILAASVAMVVVVDPIRLFWPRSEGTADTRVGQRVPRFDATTANPR
jgi:hypothetical protein